MSAPSPQVDGDFLRQVDMDPEVLVALASQKPTPLRLEDMYKYGTSVDAQQRLRNAQYLHREMPIRIAQRVVDLLTLPHGLSESKPIRQVAEIYCRYLQRFNAMPRPRSSAEEDAFTDMLQAFVLDRSSIPIAVARGVSAWESHQRSLYVTGDGEVSAEELEALEGRLNDMEDALYRFFTARVGLRLLLEHHVLSSPRPECQALRNVTHLFEDGSGKRQSELGCIQSDCNLVEETRKVADLVMKQTTEYYGMCPAIDIVDCQQTNGDDEASSSLDPFTYVTHHLHYMLAELLKNSCRATVQQYLQATSMNDADPSIKLRQRDSLFTPLDRPKLHPIRVIITKGEEDVTIKVADRGGGIPRSWMNHIWKFGHSHHSDEHEFQAEFGTSEGAGARIRGFGLPLARIYARYFGGELNLKSMEGYGVDAYLHLPRLGNSCENLPMRVRASPGERDSTPGRYHAHQVRGYGTKAISKTEATAAAASASCSALVSPLSQLLFRGEAVAQNNRAWQE
jgi:pyruvate dehydrogenase kinase 2/3/4